MTHICTDCSTPIPAGLAHVRGTLRDQLAWCGLCWQLHREVSAVLEPAVVPQQRHGGTLAERLAEANQERIGA